MARALVGHIVSPSAQREQLLALEVARLRRRVHELEDELAARSHQDSPELDLELHRIAEAAAPALA